jgi:hypothetical protein
VINSLDLPEQCGPFDNGSFLPRDACFLFFLRRLASRATLRELMERFGGERTLWGRAVKWMAIYIHERWGHKLESDFAYWAPQFPTFAACIRAVANAHPAEPAFPPEFGVAAIIDNNITETCTPGSGPATPGPGAHRRDPAGLLQRTFYTGWLHLHGVKHQVHRQMQHSFTKECNVITALYVATGGHGAQWHDSHDLGTVLLPTQRLVLPRQERGPRQVDESDAHWSPNLPALRRQHLPVETRSTIQAWGACW